MRFLQESSSVDPCLAGIWVASRVVQLTDGRGLSGSQAIHVLILQIDTGMLHAAGDDEDAVRERYRFALSSLLPVNEGVVAVSYLTTKALPDFVTTCSRIGGPERATVAAIPEQSPMRGEPCTPRQRPSVGLPVRPVASDRKGDQRTRVLITGA